MKPQQTPPLPTPEQPTILTQADEARAENILVDAFLDTPTIRYAFRREIEHKTRWVMGRWLGMALNSGRLVWLTENALAIWCPPGVESRFSLSDLRRFVWPLPPIGPGDAQRLMRHQSVRNKLHGGWPRTRWALELIGVSKRNQGQGLGARMIRAGLELADVAAAPACLVTDSSRNVTYYERFGFVVVESEQISGHGRSTGRWCAAPRCPRRDGEKKRVLAMAPGRSR